MRKPASFTNFCRAFLAEWFTAMSGAASVPLSIAAYFVENNVAKLTLALTAVACFIFASYRVWRAERTKALEADLHDNEIRIKEIEAQGSHTAALVAQIEEMRLQRFQRERENDPIAKAIREKLTGPFGASFRREPK